MNKLSLHSVLIALPIIILSIFYILGNGLWALLPIAVFLIAAIIFRSSAAIHITLFCFLLIFLPVIWTLMAWWPFSLLAPLIIYHLIVFLIPPLRRSYTWLKAGHIDKILIVIMLTTIGVSTLALIVWHRFTKPDLSLYLGQIRNMPLMLIPFAGLGFALLNSVMEEFAFRGIIMSGIDSAFNVPAVSLISQAGIFGVMHYIAGFPNGIVGILMTFVYGILLGVIRNMSKGMMAPVVTHFFADLTIFVILVTIFL